MSLTTETSNLPLQVPVPPLKETMEPVDQLSSIEVQKPKDLTESPVASLPVNDNLASPQEVSEQPHVLQPQQQFSISNLEEVVASGSPVDAAQPLQIQMPPSSATNSMVIDASPLSTGMAAAMGYPAPPSTHLLAASTLQAPLSNAQQPLLSHTTTPPVTVVSTSSHPNDVSKPIPGTDEWLKQRRESHKEVERRRREVINTGINELAKIVPNCVDRNKGGILHRSVQYIQQLKEAEQRNAERWTLDKILSDQAINDLGSYVECLKSEYEALRAQITQLGGEVPPRVPPPAHSVCHAQAMAAAMHPSYHYFAPPPPGHWPQAPYPHPGHLALQQHPPAPPVMPTQSRPAEKYEEETPFAVAASEQSAAPTPSVSTASTPSIQIHHSAHPLHPQEDTTNFEQLHPQEEPLNMGMHAIEMNTIHVRELSMLASAPSAPTTPLPSTSAISPSEEKPQAVPSLPLTPMDLSVSITPVTPMEVATPTPSLPATPANPNKRKATTHAKENAGTKKSKAAVAAAAAAAAAAATAAATVAAVTTPAASTAPTTPLSNFNEKSTSVIAEAAEVKLEEVSVNEESVTTATTTTNTLTSTTTDVTVEPVQGE